MDERLVASVTLPRRVESLREASAFVVATARAWRVPAAEDTMFEVAVVEALNNALQHASDACPGSMRCEVQLDGAPPGERTKRLTVRVLDAVGAVPVSLGLPSGTVPWGEPGPDAWQEVPPTGYGLYLIRAVFSHLRPVSRDGYHGVEMELTW